MSVDERKAWLTEAMKLAHWFRQNAGARHGVPKCAEETTLESIPDPNATLAAIAVMKATQEVAAAQPATNSPSPGLGAVPVTQGQSLLRRAAPFLLTAATGAGIPLAAYALLHKDAPPAAVQQAEPNDCSLLQYLQDNGEHLPEGSWPTK